MGGGLKMASFEEKTIMSFRLARTDVDELKRSTNEWIIFLDASLRDAKQQIRFLQKRIAELEERQDLSWQ